MAKYQAIKSDGFVYSSQKFLDASVDPYAGGTGDNGKTIWTPQQAAENLHRSGTDWTHGNYGALDDGVLTFGFWTYEQFLDSYFYELRYADGEAFNDDAFFAETYGMFEAFTAQQRVAAAANIALWDELINIKIVQGADGETSDIMFGAVYMSPSAGAHAYYPQAEDLDEYYGTTGYGQISGDVMINWLYNSPTGVDGEFVERPADTSFSLLNPGDYGWFAITHELGHSLGLSHGGDYNASDDNDGDGEPDPITYEGDAYFYQDSHQYTIMSYFGGEVTGAGWVDWESLSFIMPSTPMVHDVLAVHNIYGADPETRKGNTTYGFNSNAGNVVFDFTVNKAPVVTIYDAGGQDTLDLSGWNSDSLINLNEGAFSSASAGASLEYLKSIGFLPASYTQAQLEALFASYNTGSQGQMTDNIAIAYGTIIENAVGGGGDDLIIANKVANVLNGGAGFDTVSYQDAAAGVTASLASMRGTGGDAAGDRYINIEALAGSNFGDALSGGNGSDTISGLGGNDVISGGNGVDVLNGDDGDDRLDGGNGADTLSGGAGRDLLDGGNDNDTLSGGDGNDTLDAGNGNDVLNGGADSDVLKGGNGNDILNGGAGNDVLTGGNGKDSFVFTDAGTDTITDYQKGERIDLTAFGIDASDVTIQNGKLFADLTGDGVADLTIIVQGDQLQITDVMFG